MWTSGTPRTTQKEVEVLVRVGEMATARCGELVVVAFACKVWIPTWVSLACLLPRLTGREPGSAGS